MKKFVALLLAFTMLFAMSAHAMAAEATPARADYTAVEAAIADVDVMIKELTFQQMSAYHLERYDLRAAIDAIDWDLDETLQAQVDAYAADINARIYKIRSSDGRFPKFSMREDYLKIITNVGYDRWDYAVDVSTVGVDPMVDAMFQFPIPLNYDGIGQRVNASLILEDSEHFDLYGVTEHYVWGNDWPRYTIVPHAGLEIGTYTVWLKLEVRIPPLYAFVWDTSYVKIDLSVTPFSVYFLDYDGEILGQSSAYTYGGSVQISGSGSAFYQNMLRSLENRIANPDHYPGHHYVGWDKDIFHVTDDMVARAVYDKNEYTVRFVDWDGTLLKEETVEHGSPATAPADPVRRGYLFAGWDADFSSIGDDNSKNGDTFTFTAQYEPIVVTISKAEKGPDNNVFVNGTLIGTIKVETKNFTLYDGQVIQVTLSNRGNVNGEWFANASFTWANVD